MVSMNKKEWLQPEKNALVYTWVPDYCFKIAFVYKFQIQDYFVQGGLGTQPGLALIGHSAQPGLSSASQPGTCPSKQ